MPSLVVRVAGKVVEKLERRCCSTCVIVFWCAVAVCGVMLGPKLLDNVTMDFEPPKGSRSESAMDAFKAAFPEQATSSESVLYVEAPRGGPSLLDPQVPGGSQANSTLCALTEHVQRYLAPRGPGGDAQLSVTGLCTLDPRLSIVAKGLVAIEGHASVIELRGPTGKDNDRKAGNAILNLVKELREAYPSLYVGPFGQQTLMLEAMDGLRGDLSKMDLTIPFAFAIMAIVVKSLRLMLLPLLCLGVSFVTALLVVYLVSLSGMSINSSAPTLMSAILVALSIDYALFLLTRLSEELGGGATMKDASAVMLASSGKTIIGSGLTLCLCFVGLLAFPIQILQSVGIAIVAAVLVTMAVNLTLTPAFLLACPHFFAAAGGGSARCCGARRQSQSDAEALDAPHEPASGLANHAEPLHPRVAAEAASNKLPIWYRVARLASGRWSWLPAGVVLLGVLIPGGIMLANMKHSGSTLLMVPRSSDTPQTMRRLQHSFPAGMDSPYNLLLQPKGGGSVYNEGFFNEGRALVGHIAEIAGGGSQVLSPMWATGSPANNFSFLMISPFLMSHTDEICELLPGKSQSSQCLGLRYVANLTVNSDRSAMVAQVIIGHPLGSPEAGSFTKLARSAIDEFADSAKFVEAKLAGAGPVYADSVDVVYGLLPTVLGVTLIVVLSIVGLLYRSAGIGIRALLTIAFTIAFSFGFGMGIYQYGWLDGLGVDRFEKDGAFAWLVPPVCFSVILGLALDYDIFLVGRIVEFRLMGFSDRAAVELGLWKTGKVITAAGLIMAISFAGLMFSETAMLNQSCVMLVSAVLVDTFLVRSLIVPAVMGALGRLNWWPRRMPCGTRDAEDYVKDHMARSGEPSSEGTPPSPGQADCGALQA
mmetsp:Transcript_71789/g.185174  ORF Transcript_71789/g.185174 Transcript_71789/m.185174 type:complete len:875 (-) Transcript_71789:107-2731(-)